MARGIVLRGIRSPPPVPLPLVRSANLNSSINRGVSHSLFVYLPLYLRLATPGKVMQVPHRVSVCVCVVGKCKGCRPGSLRLNRRNLTLRTGATNRNAPDSSSFTRMHVCHGRCCRCCCCCRAREGGTTLPAVLEDDLHVLLFLLALRARGARVLRILKYLQTSQLETKFPSAFSLVRPPFYIQLFTRYGIIRGRERAPMRICISLVE